MRFELLALAWLVATPACLPAGEPPAGRQLWAGRDWFLTEILPARSPDDGVARVLARQPGPDLNEGSFLRLISVTPSGAIADQLLAERWTCNPVLGCFDVDDRGRLFVWTVPPNYSPDAYSPQLLSRIDPDSGDRIDFGAASEVAFSPSHRRVVVLPNAGDAVLLEADDGAPIELPGAIDPTFVGEDLYFVGEGQVLQRLPAGAPAEIVRQSVASFAALSTTGAPLFLLRLPSPGMSMPGPSVLLNPSTGEEWPLSSNGFRQPLVSSDGQWVLSYDAVDVTSRRKFSLLDLSTRTEEAFELPVDVGDPEWRPNHVELWFAAVTYGGERRRVFVKRPREPVREVDEIDPIVIPDSSFRRSSFFTKDGAHLFSTGAPDGDQRVQIFVGDADDPAGQRFPLNPPGTRFLMSLESSDGRLVAESFYRGPDRNDIYLVDPSDGATRLLARDGVTVAVGHSRVAALTHAVDQRGNLEIVDLDTGQATQLAKEFVEFGYVQGRPGDSDRTPPAAPVVFQFRARFASPHDGFWLTTLP